MTDSREESLRAESEAITPLAEAVDDAILGALPASDRPLNALSDFGGVYIRYRGALAAHARRFLADPHDVDDVVQETFLKLFLAMPEVETEAQALTFARRVLTNLCIDRYRAAQRRPATLNLDLGSSDYLLAEDEPTDPVVQAEDAAVVREALSRLSPLHRAALVMREVEERSLPQIAAELGIAEDSVKHLLFRARRALRRLLVGTAVDPSAPMSPREVVGVANRRLGNGLLGTGQYAVAVLVCFALTLVFTHLPSQTATSAPVQSTVGAAAGVHGVKSSHHSHRTGRPRSRRPRVAPHVAPQPVVVPLSRPAAPKITLRQPPVVPAKSGHTGTKSGTGSRTPRLRFSGDLAATSTPTIADQAVIPVATSQAAFSRFVAPTNQGDFVLKQVATVQPGTTPNVSIKVELPVDGQTVDTAPLSSTLKTAALDGGQLQVTGTIDVTPVPHQNGAVAGSAGSSVTEVSVALVLGGPDYGVVSESVNVDSAPATPPPAVSPSPSGGDAPTGSAPSTASTDDAPTAPGMTQP